jgi:hypothetical protein
VIGMRGAYTFVVALVRRRNNSIFDTFDECVNRREVALAAVAAPIIFLFVYDPLHNFYRAFFLNFAAAFTIAVHLSGPGTRRHWRTIQAGLAVVVTVCAIGSFFANADWFADAFKGTPTMPGYEGPSLSVNRDPVRLEHDVRALEAACHIDPSRGGAVVDDMTYEPLKRTPRVFPITYVNLMATLTHQTTVDVLKGAHARFALARCASMNSVQLRFTHQQGELCCVDLSGQ